MKLSVENGWFSGDALVIAAKDAPSDERTGRPATPTTVITERGDRIKGRPLFFVDEGDGKTSLTISTSDGNRRFVTSGETKHNEVRAEGINFRI